jgi:hypothetical protein
MKYVQRQNLKMFQSASILAILKIMLIFYPFPLSLYGKLQESNLKRSLYGGSLYHLSDSHITCNLVGKKTPPWIVLMKRV